MFKEKGETSRRELLRGMERSRAEILQKMRCFGGMSNLLDI